jgi:aspartyl-tRNA(Asn)/glutamyl-tRNA(Gln) amidotransferase subunit A
LHRHKDFDDIKKELFSGNTTCEKLTESYLKNIEEGKRLNAFLSVFGERATEDARRVDRKIADGTAGRLAGMVMAIKDVISIKDEKVTCASRILKDFVSIYDATVIERLKADDAIIVGKTNMDEFAMGSSNENSACSILLMRLACPGDRAVDLLSL